MRKFIIAYDLNKPGQNYNKVERALEGMGFKRVGDGQGNLTTLWIGGDGLTRSKIVTKMKEVVDKNDEIWIVPILNAHKTKLTPLKRLAR